MRTSQQPGAVRDGRNRPAAILVVLIGLMLSQGLWAMDHPRLILTRDGVADIRESLGQYPLFDASLQREKDQVDAEIAMGIDTPIPRDFSGGYTHDRHKRNAIVAQKAGALFQILEDERYAKFVRDMLFQYAEMYGDLPLHPQERSYARGKLFWQALNEAHWLVYVSQAYDAIYDWLSQEEREHLEARLFRPFADFISLENPQFFNRIHNHSTWGNAAVGMIGLVMGDEALVQRALYGIDDDGLRAGERDDDGGFIKVEGQSAGFLANLEEPFSPDGYYTEGPYYQRYAMYPFLIFSLALHNAKPELGILEHKDGVLLNAVGALLNLSDADGEFFPINDGQKGMSYYSRELVAAVDIAYRYGGRDPQLLSVAEKQDHVLLNKAGLAVARGLAEGAAEPFRKSSVNLADGARGQQGGISVLRADDEALALVFKYTAQGLSHGHYDKLAFSLYENGSEVIQDYGLVRYVNIEQKGGGNYLPENSSWAKQTIAHNTLTQNEQSHFGGDYAVGSQHHSELYFYDASRPNIHVVSAREKNAYPGTALHRTMALITHSEFEKPFVLDIFRVRSGGKNQYDLPFYFHGQVLDVNFDYEAPKRLEPLGTANGYQHLYVEGAGPAVAGSSQFSWMQEGRYYTLTSATRSSDTLFFTRLGANDPDFNLRRDPGLMIRREKTGDTVFASVIEAHGSYSPVTELSRNSRSSVAALTVLQDDDKYTVISIEHVSGTVSLFVLSNADPADSTQHRLELAGQVLEWTGPYYFREG